MPAPISAERQTDLRLGLVGPLPPPFGGMANQTRQLAGLLQAEGVTVTLVQTNATYRPAWVGKWWGLRALFRLFPYVCQLWKTAGEVDALHVMANSGWSWHLFAAPAVWIGWLRKTPVIINYRGGEAREFLSRAIDWVRPTMQRASAIVVPSGFLKAVFEPFGLETRIVPNIVDLERFSPGERCAGSWRESPHLVVTRNLESLYDVPTAIRTVAILQESIPGIRLSIAGSGPQEQSLKELTTRLGLGDVVTFTGKLTPDEMASLYRRADIMLNPATVDNMPNSVLEALACAVAVVTTDVGGIPNIVTHERTALLVSPGDADAMASQVRRLLEDVGLYRRLVENGLSEVRQYAWPAIKDAWLDVYRRAGTAPMA